MSTENQNHGEQIAIENERRTTAYHNNAITALYGTAPQVNRKCLMCGKKITATQAELDRLGWSQNRHGAFCKEDYDYGNAENIKQNRVTPISRVLRNRVDNGQRGVVLS